MRSYFGLYEAKASKFKYDLIRARNKLDVLQHCESDG